MILKHWQNLLITVAYDAGEIKVSLAFLQDRYNVTPITGNGIFQFVLFIYQKKPP